MFLELYWWVRVQQVFFDVFALLYAHGKISARALALPVNYWRTTDNSRNVMKMLFCFSKVVCLEDPPSIGEGRWLQEFSLPASWLAVMICRSALLWQMSTMS